MQMNGRALPSHAPLVLPVVAGLGFRSKIDELVPQQWDGGCTRGLAAEAVLLCILHPGEPLALFRVKDQVEELGLDVVLGVDAGKLHDNKLGEMLDALVPVDDDGKPDVRLLSSLEQHCAHTAIDWLGLKPHQVLFDFTRLRLSGAYEGSELAQPGRGSGRKKQLQIGLNTLAETGIPVLSRVHAGNANHTVDVPDNLAALQERLKGRQLVVTTDSAGLCHENIIAYNEAKMGFISPKQLTESEDAQMWMVPNERFGLLDYSPESGGRFWGHEATWELEREKHDAVLSVRVLVVRGEALRRKERKQLMASARRLDERLGEISGYLNRNRYYHREYACEQIQKAISDHAAGEFASFELEGESGEMTLSWRLDGWGILERSRRLGRYVLFTNQTPKQYDSSALLRAYKAQHGVEAGFRQLKSELHVAPVHLKKENRILAIAALYVIALMVIAVLQHLARKGGLKTPRKRPMTARELLRTYGAWTAVAVTTDDGQTYIMPNPPGDRQQRYLDALSFPQPQHWIPHKARLPDHLRIPGT
jgi:hypothetical protein